MALLFERKNASHFMTPDIRTIDEKESVFSAIDLMTHYNISCAIVTRGGKPVGIITEKDVLRRVSLSGKDLKKTIILEVMSSPLITKVSKTPIHEIVDMLNRYNIRRVVIMDDDAIKGIVTQTDIVRMSNKYIEFMEVIKLYFYLLIAIGLFAGIYLIGRAIL